MRIHTDRIADRDGDHGHFGSVVVAGIMPGQDQRKGNRLREQFEATWSGELDVFIRRRKAHSLRCVSESVDVVSSGALPYLGQSPDLSVRTRTIRGGNGAGCLAFWNAEASLAGTAQKNEQLQWNFNFRMEPEQWIADSPGNGNTYC